MVIGAFVHRVLDLKAFAEALVSTAKISGTVLIVLATGLVFGRVLTLHQIPQEVSQWLLSTF